MGRKLRGPPRCSWARQRGKLPPGRPQARPQVTEPPRLPLTRGPPLSVPLLCKPLQRAPCSVISSQKRRRPPTRTRPPCRAQAPNPAAVHLEKMATRAPPPLAREACAPGAQKFTNFTPLRRAILFLVVNDYYLIILVVMIYYGKESVVD